MIKRVEEQDIAECVKVIRESFATVAKEFGFTAGNAPRFTAFATTEDRLKHHLHKNPSANKVIIPMVKRLSFPCLNSMSFPHLMRESIMYIGLSGQAR